MNSNNRLPLATPNIPHTLSRKRAFLNGVLIALTLCLAATAWWLPLWKHQAALRKLDSAAEAMQTRAQEAEGLKQSLQRRVTTVGQLMVERRSSRPVVDILLELTNLYSDDSWVRNLKITDSEILLEGESRDTAALAKRLEMSPMFEVVELLGPIMGIKGTLYEKYRLKMKLTKPTGR